MKRTLFILYINYFLATSHSIIFRLFCCCKLRVINEIRECWVAEYGRHLSYT